MVSPSPITKIDSLDHLFDSDMTIVAREDSALYTYLTSIDSPMVDRIDIFQNYSLVQDKIFYGLQNGSLAYVNHKFILIFDVLEMIARHERLQIFNNVNTEKEFVDWLHISNDDGGYDPYFLAINTNIDKHSNNDLNIM